MRRSYLKEGEVQLTALNSLLTQSRYLFLFSDLLLVAKQKAENSYKLKVKVRLDRLWIASNNCPHSFLIGWPICNYIAHFPSEEKKIEWHDILEERIQKCRLKTIPKFTTLPLLVRTNGRNQTMKKKLTISQTSSEILAQLINELGMPQDIELELAFDSGTGDEPTVMQGPEAVYCIVMDFVRSTGYRLSEKQLERLDTFPLVSCKLVLFSMNSQKSNAAQTIVTHFKRVLSRTESRRFFGRQLDGSCPPQPVLTMMDHLLVNGVHTEGLFRKSPKQTTVRMLKAQLNRGSVPDFTQFSPHVTAAILKEYLRSIPGKLLQTCDLNMWIAAIEADGPERIAQIKGFLQLLPSSHIVLLSSLLRLLRAVTKSPSSKMNAQSLAVCIAPNLLDSPKVECAARRLPQIAEWLINNAPLLFDDFTDANCDMSSSASNDSGLSDVEVGVDASASPEFAENYIISTPPSSIGSASSSPAIRCKIQELKISPSSYCSSNLSTDDEMDMCTEIEKDDEDRTPVLSRENSSLEKKPIAFIEWKPAKRGILSEDQYILIAIINEADGFSERFLEGNDDDSRWKEHKSLKRRETVGAVSRRPELLAVEGPPERPSPSAEHCAIGHSLSIIPLNSAHDDSKLAITTLPTLPLFTGNCNEDSESNKQSISKAVHPKLEIAQSIVESVEAKKITPPLVNELLREINPKTSELDGKKPVLKLRQHETVVTPMTEANLALASENKTSQQPLLKVVSSNVVKPHLKVAPQNVIELSNHESKANEFEQKLQEIKKNLPDSSTPSRVDSNFNNIPLSPKIACRIDTDDKRVLLTQHFVAAKTTSLPCNHKTHLSDFRQRPSTSKGYEEAVNIDGDYARNDALFRSPEISPERSKLANSFSPKPILMEKKSSRPSNKLTPVQQRLKNRAFASTSYTQQIPKAQFDVDFEVRTGEERKFKQKTESPILNRTPSSASSLTINLPLFKPKEREAKPPNPAPLPLFPDRIALNSAPGPEKEPLEAKLTKNFGVHKNLENVRGSNGLAHERNDSFRKERKKNRSILMDPLEVNWSVDQLRLKFQTDSEPPTLNTEYSPSVFQ